MGDILAGDTSICGIPAEKTLGEIAQATFQNVAGPTWTDDWEFAVAAAIQAHEARRWQPIESAPKDGTPILVRAKYLQLPPWVIWCDSKCTALATDGESYWPWTDFDIWAPIPAPPKEVEKC